MDAQRISICLAIGGFSIRLSADRKIQLEDGYLPFVENQNVENPDFTIRCVERFAEYCFDASDLLFQAENEFREVLFNL